MFLYIPRVIIEFFSFKIYLNSILINRLYSDFASHNSQFFVFLIKKMIKKRTKKHRLNK